MAEKLNAVNFTSGKSVEESNKGLGGAMVGESSDKGSVNDGVKVLGQGSKVLVGELSKKPVIGGNEQVTGGNSRLTEVNNVMAYVSTPSGYGKNELVIPKARGECDITEEPDEHNPTALNLCFRNAESIPSIANLNEIFGCYGPLMESETEISIKRRSKRAKVIFKRGEDAQKACGGAVDTFGGALANYWLKYVAKPRKKAKS